MMVTFSFVSVLVLSIIFNYKMYPIIYDVFYYRYALGKLVLPEQPDRWDELTTSTVLKRDFVELIKSKDSSKAINNRFAELVDGVADGSFDYDDFFAFAHVEIVRSTLEETVELFNNKYCSGSAGKFSVQPAYDGTRLVGEDFIFGLPDGRIIEVGVVKNIVDISDDVDAIRFIHPPVVPWGKYRVDDSLGFFTDGALHDVDGETIKGNSFCTLKSGGGDDVRTGVAYIRFRLFPNREEFLLAEHAMADNYGKPVVDNTNSVVLFLSPWLTKLVDLIRDNGGLGDDDNSVDSSKFVFDCFGTVLAMVFGVLAVADGSVDFRSVRGIKKDGLVSNSLDDSVGHDDE